MTTSNKLPGTQSVKTILLHHREASGRTAIDRKHWSAPCRWLIECGSVICDSASVIDYGCGKGADVRALRELRLYVVGFDPVHAPEGGIGATGTFDVAFCTYVLNTLPTLSERMFVVEGILTALRPGGRAFVTVSRGVATGWTKTNTYQDGDVAVAYEVMATLHGVHCMSIHKTPNYEIFMVTKPQ